MSNSSNIVYNNGYVFQFQYFQKSISKKNKCGNNFISNFFP